MQNFQQQLQTPISQKQKIFSGFFIAYLECASNLEHFEKKMSILAQLFPKLFTRKSWLLKRLKGLASEHHSVSNVLTGSRHCSNQHDTTIIVFFHEFEVN